MKKKTKPTAAEKAFSSNHALNGLELQPWTPSRVVAAQSMGLLYPHVGNAGVSRHRKTGLYPGALSDTIIVLWLCSLTDEAAVREAERDPDAAMIDATKWAAAKGITRLKSEEFWSAYGKFMDIVMEVEAAASVPVATEEEDDDPGNE